MSPETEQKLARVRKYSRSLRLVFVFFTLIALFGMFISTILVLTADGDDTTLALWNTYFTGEEITPTVRILAAIYMLLVFAILLKLLRHLGGLFGLYAKGIIFEADNVRHIRHIGIAVFMFCATWVYAMLAKLLLVILGESVPIATPPVETIGFNVDNYPLLGFMTGIIIIIISWIMDAGRELREEQDLTV